MRWRSWQVGVSSTADSAASTGEVAGMRAHVPSFACACACPCSSAPMPTPLPGRVCLVFDCAHLGLVARAHPATWSCSFGLHLCSPGVVCARCLSPLPGRTRLTSARSRSCSFGVVCACSASVCTCLCLYQIYG